MGKKTYRKGNRSAEILEIDSGIEVSFFILGVCINFHHAPCLNTFERSSIFKFLNA